MGALAKLVMLGCFGMLVDSLSARSVAQESQGNGRVTMVGEVLDSACALDVRAVLYQVIDMELLSMGSLIRQGVSEPRAFKLRLIKCSLTRPDPARPDANLPDWQHLRGDLRRVTDSSGRGFAVLGAASGLALRITDSQGVESTPGSSHAAYIRADCRATGSLRLQARPWCCWISSRTQQIQAEYF